MSTKNQCINAVRTGAPLGPLSASPTPCTQDVLSYSLRMRFRPKFEIKNWIQVAVACLNIFIVLRLAGRYANTVATTIQVLCWTFLALQDALYHPLTYGELDPRCLRYRHLSKVKEIPWADVTQVSSPWFSSNCVKVDFVPHAPTPDDGCMLVCPADHQEFVDEVRRYTTQAAFD